MYLYFNFLHYIIATVISFVCIYHVQFKYDIKIESFVCMCVCFSIPCLPYRRYISIIYNNHNDFSSNRWFNSLMK